MHRSLPAGPVLGGDGTHAGESGPVWVCVPTYNEIEHVERLVVAVLGVFDRVAIDGRVLIIDDDSPDGTGRAADALVRRDARVEVLHRARKEGLGRAYLDGFRRALDGGAAFVVEMDCDFSHEPDALPDLLAQARDADLVIGSRYVPGGPVHRWGVARRMISRGGCWYARTLLGVEIRDLTGGFKCFRRAVLETIPLHEVTSAGYAFQIELTYRAIVAGLRVREVPIAYTERTLGTSKMSRRIAVEGALAVPRLRRRLPRRPVAPGIPSPAPALLHERGAAE